MSAEGCDVTNCCLVKCLEKSCKREAVLGHLMKALSIGNQTPPQVMELKPNVPDLFISNGDGNAVGCVYAASPILHSFQCFDWVQEGNHHLYICVGDISVPNLLGLLQFMGVTNIGPASRFLHIFGTHCNLVWKIEAVKFDGSQQSKIWFAVSKNEAPLFEQMVSRFMNANVFEIACLNMLGRGCVAQGLQHGNLSTVSCSLVFDSNTDTSPSFPSLGYYDVSYFLGTSEVVDEIVITRGQPSFLCSCNERQMETNGYEIKNIIANACETASSFLPKVQDIDIEENSIKEEDEEDIGATDEQIMNGNQTHQPSCSKVTQDIITEDNQDLSTTLQSMKGVKLSKYISESGHIFQCPACYVAFKGGVNSYIRLLHHVKETHEKRRHRYLIREIKQSYLSRF